MGRIGKWLHKVSIPAAFIICALSCLLVAILLTKATVWFAQKNRSEIEGEYVSVLPLDMDEVLTGEFIDNLGVNFIGDGQGEQNEQLPAYVVRTDGGQLLWQSISLENNLNFQIEYEGQDEFGRLCHAFEMRQELEQNNKKMWNSIEERKRLNAAFAHDLRTPLTVMRGHTDMLLSTITEDTDPSGEMANSIHAISNQITRLGAFADTMGSLQRLEDYEPCLKHIPSAVLTEMVSQAAIALIPNGQIEIHSELKEQDFLLDKEALAQICENILSNAARYVKEVVTLTLEQKQEYLIITVEDDGTGFTKKDLANASLAYYRGEKTQTDAVSHFGLGLYISSILAEKLGGGLQLSNGASGGAKIQIKVRCI